jgi:hypothetical protein
MTDKELGYVIASRAKGETHLFCERSTVPYLADQLSRSRAKTMAHDFLPSQEQELVRREQERLRFNERSIQRARTHDRYVQGDQA